MKKLSLLIIALFSIQWVSCSGNENAQDVDTGADSLESNNPEEISIQVDTVATGLNVPWGMAFLPDGRILVTEKSGEILIVEDGKLSDQKVQGVPEVFDSGQGGLLDIQLHPEYQENGWIYFTYSKPLEGGAVTTLSRAKLDGNQFTDLQEVVVVQPGLKTAHHFGSRIAFDNEGYLYFTAGERGTKENSQDLTTGYGNVHRIFDDGRVPDDNPFVDTPNAQPSIWSYGHRNPQGLYFDKDSGILWEHEHGPKGGDELNIIKKGENYGWPVTTYGIDYDGSTISEISEKEGITNPVNYWVPSIAPSGMTMIKGDLFSDWKNNLLIGALSHQHVTRVVLNGEEFESKEIFLEEVGRVRAVSESPDGHIYVAVEGPGMLLKLSPKE